MDNNKSKTMNEQNIKRRGYYSEIVTGRWLIDENIWKIQWK